MSRYLPSRRFLWVGFTLWGLAAVSGWAATRWPPAIMATLPLFVAAALFAFLGLRPPVEIHEQYLVVGRRAIPWAQIRRVDRARWDSPLIVRLTLADDRRVFMIYPGPGESASSLLRQIRRGARKALIEGQPYREFWGEAVPEVERGRRLAAPRCRLLRPEDEEEVERMYQRLRAVGHIDSKSSADET